MADDSDNDQVLFVLNLENKEFEAKMGKSKSMFGQLENAAHSAFNKALFGVISFNQALELGQKALEFMQTSLEKMEQAEGIKNQETALKNLASTIGANAGLIVESIKKTTGGTVTQVEATRTAFELLKSGVRAEYIPAIVAFADKTEKASGGTQKFADIIHNTAMAVDTGMSRGLRQYGIEVEATGSRQIVLNSILKQMEVQSKALGEGYDETAARMATKTKSLGDEMSKVWGGISQKLAVNLFGDEVDKLAQSHKNLEAQLKRIDEAAANGSTQFSIWTKDGNQFLSIEQARAETEKQLNEIKSVYNKELDKEKASTDELNSKLTQTGEIKKTLTDAQKKSVELSAQEQAIANRAAEEEFQFGQTTIKTQDDLYNARKKKIESEIDLERSRIVTESSSEEELQNKLVALEEEKFARISALRMNDEQFKQIMMQAELNTIENNMRTVEGAEERHREAYVNMENNKYMQEIGMIKNSQLTQEQTYAELEKAELQHQKRLSEIRQQYESLNVRNLKLGVAQSLDQMREQYANFSKMAASATTATQNLMARSFVEEAKGHGKACNIMKEQFLEMIGTKMIESGVYHILAGIWPPNPVELGQGAALIAAGSALVGASGAGAASGATGGSAGQDVGTDNKRTPGAAKSNQMERKHADIIIQGDWLNSRETANHLADVIRENSDVTDYAITAQGQNYIQGA